MTLTFRWVRSISHFFARFISLVIDLHFPTVEAQVATSLTILGAWIGSMASSGPCERYGMRLTLLGNAVFFIAGSVMAASGDVSALFVGRLISGKSSQQQGIRAFNRTSLNDILFKYYARFRSRGGSSQWCAVRTSFRDSQSGEPRSHHHSAPAGHHHGHPGGLPAGLWHGDLR